MTNQHKDILKALTPIEIGGDYETHLEETGIILDAVSTRTSDLLDEMFPSKAHELISEWENSYGITSLNTDTLSERLVVLVNKVKEFGSLHKSFYINLSEQKGVFITIEEPLKFIVGVDQVGDKLGAPHTWEVKMNLSDQHRFPFIVGVNLVGDKLVTFDIQNSLESILERLKPASSQLFFGTFNWGFEDDFVDWTQGDSATDAVTVRTGTKSAKLEASGANVLGPTLRPIEINPASFYKLEFYINIANYTAGNFIAKLNYYDNILGTGTPIQTETLFTRTAITAGFVLESHLIGGAGLTARGSEVLDQSNFTSNDKWATTGDFNVLRGNAAYLDNSNIGTLIQLSANFLTALVPGETYELVYTVDGVIGTPTCLIAAAGIALTDTSLTLIDGAQSTQLTVKAVPTDFQLDGASTALEQFTLDDLSLKQVTTPDFVIPTNAKSVDVSFEWDTTPTGIAYIDDLVFNFV